MAAQRGQWGKKKVRGTRTCRMNYLQKRLPDCAGAKVSRRGLAGRKSEFDEIQFEREFSGSGSAEREIKRRKGDAKELIKFRAGRRGGESRRGWRVEERRCAAGLAVRGAIDIFLAITTRM